MIKKQEWIARVTVYKAVNVCVAVKKGEARWAVRAMLLWMREYLLVSAEAKSLILREYRQTSILKKVLIVPEKPWLDSS